MPASLKYPPIVEVVCGLFFEPLVGLDPMLVGKFWSERSKEYPHREVHRPVQEQVGFFISSGVPSRCWLISNDDQFVVQIQQDRFYFNWRKRGDQYPRFGDHDGARGVLSRCMDEFDQFAAFCERELSKHPTAAGIELSKIDQVSYVDHQDFEKLIRVAGSIAPLKKSSVAEITIHLAEKFGEIDLRVGISNAIVTPDFGPAVKLESRAAIPVHGRDVSELFTKLNGLLNETFDTLFSEEALERFQGEGTPHA